MGLYDEFSNTNDLNINIGSHCSVVTFIIIQISVKIFSDDDQIVPDLFLTHY